MSSRAVAVLLDSWPDIIWSEDSGAWLLACENDRVCEWFFLQASTAAKGGSIFLRNANLEAYESCCSSERNSIILSQTLDLPCLSLVGILALQLRSGLQVVWCSMPPKHKAKTKIKSETATTTKSTSTPPNWPALKPVLDASALSIEETLKNQILVVPNLFTSNLCKTYVSFLSGLDLTTTPGKPKRGEATRVNDRFQIDDPAFAQSLWKETAIKDLVESYEDKSIWGGEVLGLNSNVRVYRYRPGQFFDQHYDESNKVAGPGGVPAKTTWTLLIYLTACEGGETAFYPEPISKKEKVPDPIVVDPQAGSALFHRHFPECLLHEGKEVLSGEKWVLRSDLVVAR